MTIPAATLLMGCDPLRDPTCAADEKPRHPVRVDRYRIQRREVAGASYAACVAQGACTKVPGLRPRYPVTRVTWAQAHTYCRWAGGRLPTEAEWELAARGTDGRIYPWGDEPPTCARAFTRACGAGPAPVGGRRPGASPFGVLDMAGNVDEWVADRYGRYPGPARGSWVPHPTGAERVARGGAYDAWHSRSTARNALAPDYRDELLGFRCAASGE